MKSNAFLGRSSNVDNAAMASKLRYRNAAVKYKYEIRDILVPYFHML